MILLSLARKSLVNRWLTAGLTVLAIAMSVMLFLGVEKVRNSARTSFANTISDTDLIVGARSGSVQLLLYSVFRIGNATQNITWKSVEDVAARPEVDWLVPLSLGDSHRGFRVLGTSAEYFDRYRYRGKRKLEFSSGRPFDDLFEAVVGADVAQALGYKTGDKIIVSHGLGDEGFSDHEDKPFTVSGVLAKTGTPVDRTVHVSMEAIEAIHVDWKSGARMPGISIGAGRVRQLNLKPKNATALLIGVKSKLQIFKLQRYVNTFRAEPLLAVIPGVALQELWGLVGTAETALAVISAMVVVTALLGMATMTLSTLNERRREMAILRSVGARPSTVIGLLMTEAAILSIAGVALGVAGLYGVLYIFRPLIDAKYGLYLTIDMLTNNEWAMIGAVVLAGILVSAIPSCRAYRMSLADGMMVRS
ncbi:MAG: ABC transporter permease [Hyphomicrobiales bacterium]